MPILALKLALVPILVFVVSMSGKWWGPTVAGWLAGLPIVAGPILFLLVADRGADFGAMAALFVLAGILACDAYNMAYAWTARVTRWPGALLAGIAAWLAGAALMSLFPASPWIAVGAPALSVLISMRFLPRSTVRLVNAPLTRADLAGRMLAGAVLTLTVTGLADVLGAGWTGLLAGFPLLAVVLTAAIHRSQGADAVVRLAHGMVLGRFSFAAFCLSLSYGLRAWPVWVAFVVAYAAAVLVQMSTRRWVRQ